MRALGFDAERIACGPYGSGRKSAADIASLPRRDAAAGAGRSAALAERMDADLVYLNGPRLLPAAAMAGLGRPVLFHSHSYLGPGAVRAHGGRSRCAAWTPRLVAQCEFVAAPWRPFVRPERISRDL